MAAREGDLLFKDELSAKRTIIRENPEAEGSSRQTNDPELRSIVIEPVGSRETSSPTSSSSLTSYDEWLNAIINYQSNQRMRPKIPKVVEILRSVESNFMGCFDPIVVSIGPYHHGKPHLQEMENNKIVCANQFVADIGESIHTVYDKFKEVAMEAREYYDYDIKDSKGADKDMEEFTRMMFLDGCFILQFMLVILDPKRRTQMGMKRTYVQRDLFLLENQLPYIVLQKLMSMRFIKAGEGDEMIDKFIQYSHSVPTEPASWLNCNLCFGSKWRATSSKPEDNSTPQHVHHLLQLLRERVDSLPAIDNNGSAKDSIDWYYYSQLSAKELNNVGITFKPNKSGKFRDVSFATRFFLFGELTLAPLLVDDSTKSMLLNMVAWEGEMLDAGGSYDDMCVMCYICFMSSLLRHPEDVKVLTSHNIIFNYIGNEQQVVDLFHHISNDLIPTYPHSYRRVYTGISKHFGNKVKLLIAEWLHAHFSTSWSILAFLATVFAILLTLIQTYFTANPPK